MKLVGKVEKFEEVVWQTKGDMDIEKINYTIKEMSTNIEEAMELLEKIEARVDLIYGLGDISNLLSNITFEELVSSVNSAYCFGTESTVRGFFPLIQDKVLEFYINLNRFEEHEVVGECCIITIDNYLKYENEEVVSMCANLYKEASKFDPNPFIEKDPHNGVFQIRQTKDNIFKIDNTKLVIDFFEGILDGNMDVSLRAITE